MWERDYSDDETQTDKIGYEVEDGAAREEHDMKQRDKRTFVAFLLAELITTHIPNSEL